MTGDRARAIQRAARLVLVFETGLSRPLAVLIADAIESAVLEERTGCRAEAKSFDWRPLGPRSAREDDKRSAMRFAAETIAKAIGKRGET